MPLLSKFLPALTFVITISAAAILTTGCEPERNSDFPDSGIDTLSSDVMVSGSAIEIQGFDFSEARIRYEIPNPGGNAFIDMAIRPLMGGDSPIGAVLYLPVETQAFYDMGPTTMESVTEAPAEGYIPEINLNVGYVYCVLTAEGKYAKMQVLDIDYGTREGGAAYAWFRFTWAFQTDGSRDLTGWGD